MADVERVWQHGYKTGGASLVDVKTVGRSRRVHASPPVLTEVFGFRGRSGSPGRVIPWLSP
jgi:hypothetical protein